MSLGGLIKQRRKVLGLSLRQVETLTGGKVSNAYLSQVESGHVKAPSILMLHRIAAALALDFGELAEVAIGARETPEPPRCPTCGQSIP